MYIINLLFSIRLIFLQILFKQINLNCDHEEERGGIERQVIKNNFINLSIFQFL